MTHEFAAFADEVLGDWRPLGLVAGRAERELMRAHQRAEELAAGVAASSDLFCTLAAWGTIETANPRWLIALGVNPERTPWGEHVAAVDRSFATTALATGDPIEALSVTMRTVIGAHVTVCWSFTAALPHGTRVGVGRIGPDRALCEADRPKP